MYIIVFLLSCLCAYTVYQLFSKPKLKYGYHDVIDYHNSVKNAAAVPLPLEYKELDSFLAIVNETENDEIAIKNLAIVYQQLITVQDGLDIFILKLSELLYDRAVGLKDVIEANKAYRASRITRRLAHNLYRKYKLKNPKHNNARFLQFVD